MRWMLVMLAIGCSDPVPEVDAGRDAGRAQDAGDDAGPMCPDQIIESYVGDPPCSVATRECAMACPTRSCATQCAVDDPNPACIQCWDTNQLACWNRNGCQPQFNCLYACMLAACPETFTCIGPGEACDAEDDEFAACFEPLLSMCDLRAIECLPE